MDKIKVVVGSWMVKTKELEKYSNLYILFWVGGYHVVLFDEIHFFIHSTNTTP